MGSNESDGAVFLLVYGGLILAAVRLFGVRRVLWGLLIVVTLALLAAFKTLGAITGSRRY